MGDGPASVQSSPAAMRQPIPSLRCRMIVQVLPSAVLNRTMRFLLGSTMPAATGCSLCFSRRVFLTAAKGPHCGRAMVICVSACPAVRARKATAKKGRGIAVSC